MAALRDFFGEKLNPNATSHDVSLEAESLFELFLRRTFRMESKRNWITTEVAMAYLVKDGKAYRPIETLSGVRKAIKNATEKGIVVRFYNAGSEKKPVYMWHREDIIEFQRRRVEGL